MTATALPGKANSTVLTVLFAAAFCHLINDTMQAVMLACYPLLRDSYALTFTQVGMITMCFQVLASALQPIIGYLTDRRPAPWIMPFAPACTTAGMIILAMATSYPVILVAAMVVGVGSSVFHPDASRVARLSAGGRFGFAQSTFQVGGNLGTAIGPLLAAAIVLPRGQSALAWFALPAMIAVVLLGYVARWYQQHLAIKNAAAKKQAVPAHPPGKVAFALAIIVVLMISKFVYTSSLHSFYSLYLIDHFGVSKHEAQIFLFVFLASVALGTFAGGPIGDRIGAKAVIWFSILGALPFTLALPYMGLWGTVAMSVPIGVIISSAFPAMVVYAQELLPGRVGMISGLLFGLAFGVAGFGAVILGFLGDAWGIRFVFQACSFLPALGIFALLLPKLKQV